MRGRSVRVMVLFAFIGALSIPCMSGCTRRCSSQCEPRGPWQSPTIQATRSLLLVNTTELKILRIDGRNVRPSCVGQGGVHEYHIPPGEHELTASFRYMARVGAGLISEAYGRPLTLCHTFVPGHEYVAVYREQFLPKAEAATLAQALAITVLQPYEGTWSMRIIDLADAEPDDEPEVLKAQIYSALIGAAARAMERDMSSSY